MILRLMIAIAVAVYAGGAWADYEETRELSLPTEGVESLVIDCGAGSLDLVGVEGLESIEVVATIRLRGVGGNVDEALRDHVVLDLSRTGRLATLTAKVDSDSRGWWIFSDATSGRIDLEVRMPRLMNLDVDDGSGDMTLANVHGTINIEDGSGDLEIRDFGGELYLRDGSGQARLSSIDGDAEIEDGSGDLQLEGTTGRLRVEDGSGNLILVGIQGDVHIDDGSGDLNVRNVGGTVMIDDGSGDITIEDVKRDVILLNEGSGGVSFRNVQGSITRED